jgi:hypothetical protein
MEKTFCFSKLTTLCQVEIPLDHLPEFIGQHFFKISNCLNFLEHQDFPRVPKMFGNKRKLSSTFCKVPKIFGQNKMIKMNKML